MLPLRLPIPHHACHFFIYRVGCTSDSQQDFVMIVSPVGPPALTLAAIVAMSDAGEETSAVVAKTLVISYILTPLISITVTAAISIVKTLY